MLKLCNRLVSETPTAAAVASQGHRSLLFSLLHDIYECFLCFLSNKEARTELAVRVGCSFNINRDEVLSLLVSHKPNFQRAQSQLICGRVKLPLEASSSSLMLLQKNLLHESSLLYV